MNAPRDLGPDFRSWMGDVPEPPEVLPARTLEQTRHTRQRRRWLWFLPGRKPTAGALDEPDDGPAPSDQPTVGITPGRVKGTITMFSASKIIAAASVLALSAGIASSGVLTTEPGTPAAGPVWTGDYFDSDEGLVAVSGSGRFGPSPGVVTGTVIMSDPRVSGDLLAGYQWLCEPNESCTSWGSATLTNDGGTWEGDFVAFNGPAPGHLQNLMIWMNGTGEYEGLSHVVNFVGPMIDSIGTGQIIDAPLPPQVALDWAAEIAD